MRELPSGSSTSSFAVGTHNLTMMCVRLRLAHPKNLCQDLGISNLDLKVAAVVSEFGKHLKFHIHCCRERHYYFEVKKCGAEDCRFCTPPRLFPETFNELHSLPDPMPAEENHYKTFGELFGKETSDMHKPSLTKIISKYLPFYLSVHIFVTAIQCSCVLNVECGD